MLDDDVSELSNTPDSDVINIYNLSCVDELITYGTNEINFQTRETQQEYEFKIFIEE